MQMINLEKASIQMCCEAHQFSAYADANKMMLENGTVMARVGTGTNSKLAGHGYVKHACM